MNKLTLILTAGAGLLFSASVLAEGPANSISTQQEQKEQLSNSGHIFGDCRAPVEQQSAETRSHCQTKQGMDEQNLKNKRIMRHTGDDDRVKDQDINNKRGTARHVTEQHKQNDQLMRHGATKDQIEQGSTPSTTN